MSGVTNVPEGKATPQSDAVEELKVGLAIVELLTRPSWVHRRAESIEFLDAERVHRQTSVDFTLPDRDAAHALYVSHPGLIPLATLTKRKLKDFSLRDESGRRLPMLTTAENGYFAGAALVALVRSVGVLYGRKDLPPVALELFREIARTANHDDGMALYTFLRENGSMSAAGLSKVKEARSRALIKAAALELRLVHQLLTGDPIRAPDGTVSDHTRAAREGASAALSSLADQLARQFIVLVQLPSAGYMRTDRRLLKFEYEAQSDVFRPRLKIGARLGRAATALFERMSWWPARLNLDVLPVGEGQSYHLELSAPEDLVIVGGSLTAIDPRRPDEAQGGDQWEPSDRERLHLHVSGVPRAAVGLGWVRVRSSRGGFLFIAWLTAGFVAALLAVGTGRVSKIDGGDVEAAAAIVLTIPGLVSIYLVRPDEHRLVSRLLTGPRAFVAIAGLCTFVAAGVLAGDYSAHTAHMVWRDATYVAVGAFAALSLSLLVPGGPAFGIRCRAFGRSCHGFLKRFRRRPISKL